MSDRPRLLAEKCSTCVFRPGNLMRLQEGRLAELIARNRATGSMLICHDHSEKPKAMCRGYWDAYADESSVVQVMARLFGPDWYEEVSGLD